MGRLITLLAGILIGAILMYIGFNYHVVVTEKTYYMIPKKKAQLADVYVDIREWGIQEWARKPALAEAVTAAGHGELVKQSVQNNLLEDIFRSITPRP